MKSMKPGKLFIISAPSGVGKTTIKNELLRSKRLELNLNPVITYTSRPPRSGEVDGQDYHFLTRQDFETKQNQGFFLETTEYDRNLYGSPKSIITEMAHGKSYLMVVDRPGALRIKDLVPGAVLIWIDVSDPQEIKRRLLSRDQNPEAVQRRFEIACKERSEELNNPHFKYHVFNDVLERAVKEVERIMRKEID